MGSLASEVLCPALLARIAFSLGYPSRNLKPPPAALTVDSVTFGQMTSDYQRAKEPLCSSAPSPKASPCDSDGCGGSGGTCGNGGTCQAGTCSCTKKCLDADTLLNSDCTTSQCAPGQTCQVVGPPGGGGTSACN